MRQMLSRPVTRLCLIAAALVLAISGPFGTLDSMSFGPRLAYWAITAPLTFALGVWVSLYLSERLRHAEPAWIVPLSVGLGAGVSIALLVLLLNVLAFGPGFLTEASLPPLLASVMATAAAIALVLYFAGTAQQPPEPAQSQRQLPRLLQRLELEKRGRLISLTVQDHYVEVTTDKGSALVLMRLSDAIAETAPTRGLQVHRSHWVALDEITKAQRSGDKALLTLSDGRSLPASRSNIKALKDAGILPR